MQRGVVSFLGGLVDPEKKINTLIDAMGAVGEQLGGSQYIRPLLLQFRGLVADIEENRIGSDEDVKTVLKTAIRRVESLESLPGEIYYDALDALDARSHDAHAQEIEDRKRVTIQVLSTLRNVRTDIHNNRSGSTTKSVVLDALNGCILLLQGHEGKYAPINKTFNTTAKTLDKVQGVVSSMEGAVSKITGVVESKGQYLSQELGIIRNDTEELVTSITGNPTVLRRSISDLQAVYENLLFDIELDKQTSGVQIKKNQSLHELSTHICMRRNLQIQGEVTYNNCLQWLAMLLTIDKFMLATSSLVPTGDSSTCYATAITALNAGIDENESDSVVLRSVVKNISVAIHVLLELRCKKFDYLEGTVKSFGATATKVAYTCDEVEQCSIAVKAAAQRFLPANNLKYYVLLFVGCLAGVGAAIIVYNKGVKFLENLSLRSHDSILVSVLFIVSLIAFFFAARSEVRLCDNQNANTLAKMAINIVPLVCMVGATTLFALRLFSVVQSSQTFYQGFPLESIFVMAAVSLCVLVFVIALGKLLFDRFKGGANAVIDRNKNEAADTSLREAVATTPASSGLSFLTI